MSPNVIATTTAARTLNPPPRVMSPLGVAKLKQWESPGGKAVLHAYEDSAGVWTIGHGHIRGVRPGMVCTEEQAERWLLEDLAPAEWAVHDLVSVPLTQPQFDALVSFAFNVGIAAFEKSTLLRVLNDGRYDLVPEQMMRWVHVTIGGVKQRLPGLVNRRTYEIELWNTPADATAPVEPGREISPDELPPTIAPVGGEIPDPPPSPKTVLGTSTGKAQATAAGSAVAAKAAGDMAGELHAQAGLMQQIAPYLEVAQWVFIALFVGAIGFTMYERWAKLREGK